MLLAGWALPAAADTLSYVILKEGEPIGHETVSLTRSGERSQVHVVTETRVKVLFVNFHFSHRRDESWVGASLEQMVSDTDDDGDIHHLEVHRDARSVQLEVDGQHRQVSADALPLCQWTRAILDHPQLYSVIDAAPYAVTVTDLGPETVALAGRQVTAEHYHMAGGTVRELWYGADGLLVKTTFERRGYPIAVVRE